MSQRLVRGLEIVSWSGLSLANHLACRCHSITRLPIIFLMRKSAQIPVICIQYPPCSQIQQPGQWPFESRHDAVVTPAESYLEALDLRRSINFEKCPSQGAAEVTGRVKHGDLLGDTRIRAPCVQRFIVLNLNKCFPKPNQVLYVIKPQQTVTLSQC